MAACFPRRQFRSGGRKKHISRNCSQSRRRETGGVCLSLFPLVSLLVLSDTMHVLVKSHIVSPVCDSNDSVRAWGFRRMKSPHLSPQGTASTLFLSGLELTPAWALTPGAWGAACQPRGGEGFWKPGSRALRRCPRSGSRLAPEPEPLLTGVGGGWGQENYCGGSGPPIPGRVLNKALESAVSSDS